MKEISSEIETHVFICTNQKAPGKECCALKGAEELRLQLKEWAKENPDWRKRVRINASGCLDKCSEGIALAVYPHKRWLVGVSVNEIEQVKKFISDLAK